MTQGQNRNTYVEIILYYFFEILRYWPPMTLGSKGVHLVNFQLEY